MNVKKYVVVFSLMFFVEISLGQNTFPPSGNVGIGTTSPRGQFDVAGTGDIFLSNNPIAGTGQSIYLPGHIFLAPYSGSDWTYLQARRFDSSGSTHLQFRTWNAGSLTDAMVITSIGRVGVGTYNPAAKLHVRDGQVMSSDLNYDNINIRLDGRAIPAINFTRFIGSGSIQHNAFVGQFYNNSAGSEYSFGIGTGYSASGDQTINTKALTVLLNGNVGIGTTAPDGFQVNAPLGNENAQSTSNIRIGMLGSTPRIILDKAGSVPFEIDNAGGQLRIFNPGAVRLVVNSNGFVGIGTASPDEALTVRGKIHTNEVKVDLLGAVAPDYVFEPTYDLKPLAEIETYIKENKHLPEVPSAKEMEKNGLQLGEMNMLLLKKIEEMTLHLIEQQKQIEELKKSNVRITAEMASKKE